MTPAAIDIGSSSLAPSLPIFFFDLILESNFSLRPLRSLILSLPSSVLLLVIFNFLKKRFY